MTAATTWIAEHAHRPRPGESLNGFVARAAAQEHLPTVFELTGMAGIVWSQRPELSRGDCDLNDLARFLKVEPSALSDLVYPVDPARPGRRLYFGISVDRRHLLHDERRFSPSSLAEEDTHLAVWQLRPFPFCERSGELLVARCPDAECETRQRWYHAVGIGLCDACGEPLHRAPASLVPEVDLRDLRRALGLVHPDARRRAESLALLPPALHGMGAGDVLDLLVAVAGVQSPELRCRSDRRILRPNADPIAVCAAMAEAWRIACRWPEGFDELAAKRIAGRPGRFGDGNGGATMRFLDLPSSPGTPQPLAATVSELRLRLSRSDGDAVGSNEASRLPHLTASGLVELRRSGRLSTIFALVDGEPQPLLVRGEVEALSRTLRSSLPIRLAASRLAVTEDGIEDMAAAGLIALAGASAMRRGREAKVDGASIDDLIARLEAAAGSGRCEYVPLTTVLRMIGGRLKPWAAIVRVFLSGRVRYAMGAGAGAIVKRISVEPQAIPRLVALESEVGEADPPRRLSRGDALVVLNLHPRHGASTLASWADDGPGRVVPVDDLLTLARERISLGEISAVLGLHAAQVDRLLMRLDIDRDGPFACRSEVTMSLLDRWTKDEAASS